MYLNKTTPGGIVRNVFSPLLSGGSVIACGGFDAVLFWDTLGAHRVTWYYASPTMHHAILSQAADRYCACVLEVHCTCAV